MDISDYKSQQEFWKNESEKYQEEISRKFEEVIERSKSILGIGLVSGLITCIIYYIVRDRRLESTEISDKKHTRNRKNMESSRLSRLVSRSKSELNKVVIILILSAIKNLLTKFLEKSESEENAQDTF